jgi:hypothetical protein
MIGLTIGGLTNGATGYALGTGCDSTITLALKLGLFERALNVLLSTQPFCPPTFAFNQSSSVIDVAIYTFELLYI